MTILAIITALVIVCALCGLVGYAVGMTRGEIDGARRERLTAAARRAVAERVAADVHGRARARQ